jgi:hypothetical protein
MILLPIDPMRFIAPMLIASSIIACIRENQSHLLQGKLPPLHRGQPAYQRLPGPPVYVGCSGTTVKKPGWFERVLGARDDNIRFNHYVTRTMDGRTLYGTSMSVNGGLSVDHFEKRLVEPPLKYDGCKCVMRNNFYPFVNFIKGDLPNDWTEVQNLTLSIPLYPISGAPDVPASQRNPRPNRYWKDGYAKFRVSKVNLVQVNKEFLKGRFGINRSNYQDIREQLKDSLGKKQYDEFANKKNWTVYQVRGTFKPIEYTQTKYPLYDTMDVAKLYFNLAFKPKFKELTPLEQAQVIEQRKAVDPELIPNLLYGLPVFWSKTDSYSDTYHPDGFVGFGNFYPTGEVANIDKIPVFEFLIPADPYAAVYE